MQEGLKVGLYLKNACKLEYDSAVQNRSEDLPDLPCAPPVLSLAINQLIIHSLDQGAKQSPKKSASMPRSPRKGYFMSCYFIRKLGGFNWCQLQEMSHRQMMPEAGGFIFSTESPTLLNSKDKKGGCGEGINRKKWTSYSLEIMGHGESRVGWSFFFKGRKKLGDYLQTLSVHPLEKLLPDELHYPGQKAALKTQQESAVPLGCLQPVLQPEQGITSSEALSHPCC